MDGIREFLDAVRVGGHVPGRLRGLFHVAIGRKISKSDGSVVSAGVTWRELSVLLKDLRFDKELVKEIGADLDELAPRDRQRFWYSAIALAHVDSKEAFTEAEQLAVLVQPLGYVIGPPPAGTVASSKTPTPPKPAAPPAKKPKKK
jgi:hypothetical protein